MDIRKLKTILELFENSTLTEMEFCEGEEKVRLSKTSPASGAPAAAPVVVSAAAPATTTATAPAATDAATDAKEAEDEDGVAVKSPMVGTFYRAAAPDKPPFVRVGQTVSQGDTLCIVEAMKLMNEIPSPTSGVIKKIMVENNEAVSYGTVLFVIG